MDNISWLTQKQNKLDNTITYDDLNMNMPISAMKTIEVFFKHL
jgi:hypothetical protein